MCDRNQFDVTVVAPSYLQQGDTLTASIFFAEKIPVEGRITIGENTLVSGRIDEANYQVKANELGRHQFEGEFLIKTETGETKTYPFTHEYTIVPKSKH